MRRRADPGDLARKRARALHIELTARGAQLLQDGYLMVRAPEEPGSYLMVVRGTVRDRDQLYSIYAEERITVEAEKE